MKLRKIMIIDDSDADLLFTELILQAAEVAQSILSFETAIAALDHLRQQPSGVDLILLDINMPEMNGFEFLEIYDKLHASKQSGAGVVMLTSSANPADRARAASYPCVKGYVIKPIDLRSAQQLTSLATSWPAHG